MLALAISASAAVALHDPKWIEISPQQKTILAPLSGEWDQMDATQRKKWLGIAQRFPSMKPEEQIRVQERMTEWVKLRPEERQSARSKYKDLKKAPPEKQAAVKQKWQEYETLPDDEKQRLKQQHAQHKSRSAKAATKPPTAFRPAIPKPQPSADNMIVPLTPVPQPKAIHP
jgi:hypothetical protein